MKYKRDEEEMTKQNKVISLFQYIAELIKQKAVLNVKNYIWHRSIASFPDDPENIKIYYRDCVQVVFIIRK